MAQKNKDSPDHREVETINFETFYFTYYPILFRVGYQLCGEKELTKDVLQSFFLELWEKKADLSQIQYLKAYLTKAFRRKMVRLLQDRREHKKKQLSSIKESSTPSYEALLIHQEHQEVKRLRLHHAIESLPTQQKEVLRLRFLQGLDYSEIADSTGKDLQTVYNQVHAAIKKLRKVLLPIFLLLIYFF